MSVLVRTLVVIDDQHGLDDILMFTHSGLRCICGSEIYAKMLDHDVCARDSH